MNRFWLYIGAIGGLSILLVSCNNPEKLPPVSVVPVSTPQSTTIKDGSLVTPQVAVIKDSPIVAAKTAEPIAATGLITSTNGDSWAKTVAKGRINPFADISLQPISVADKVSTDSIEPIPVIKKLGKKLIIIKKPVKILMAGKKTYVIASNSSVIRSGVNKKLPQIKFGSTVAVKSKMTSHGNPPAVFKSIEPVRPALIPVVAIVPPRVGSKILPNPIDRFPVVRSVLANTIEITGVIDIGNRSQVIVKLPNEALSRYVEVGDLIPDTNVRVDRVDVQADSTRIIVLEESGIQIYRKLNDLKSSTTYKTPVVSQPNTYLFTEGSILPSAKSGQYIQVFDSNTMPITSQSIPTSTETNWIYPF